MATTDTAVKTYYTTAAALAVLLVATIVAARFDLGAANLPIAVGIAAAKAVLIAACFMHLRWSVPLARLFAVVGLLGLALLLTLTAADVRRREPPEAFGWAPHDATAAPPSGGRGHAP